MGPPYSSTCHKHGQGEKGTRVGLPFHSAFDHLYSPDKSLCSIVLSILNNGLTERKSKERQNNISLIVSESI